MNKIKFRGNPTTCQTPKKNGKGPLCAALSPAQKKAAKISSKYKRGYRKSPGKLNRVKTALVQVENGCSIRQAAIKNGLTESFLRRRLTGDVLIDRRNGPPPVFSVKEEEEMAKWLSEMARRGMGLGVSDFLDFVQSILEKDKRKNQFKNNRPSYTWYYSFMARNAHLVEMRKESPLENSRAKVTPRELDKWFTNYYQFVSKLHLLDKCNRIYNADESGFCMGSKEGSVIGPLKSDYPGKVPHLSGKSKKRLTAMFCANAAGDIMPPFLIYPGPKPTAYDPLINSREGTVVEYTEKGWMNAKTFLKFLEHFDRNACRERPLILLIDSVSSHIDLDVFTFAKEKGIELYRLIPNATHFLQPLDNGVFGQLKKSWYQVVRKYTKDNPDKSIGKENFASKLHEAFMNFYKPLTVVNSFKATGIFPVDRSRIADSHLKPALTFEPAISANVEKTCDMSCLPVCSETTCDIPMSCPQVCEEVTASTSTSLSCPEVCDQICIDANDKGGIESGDKHYLPGSNFVLVADAEDNSPLSLLANVAFTMSGNSSKTSTCTTVEHAPTGETGACQNSTYVTNPEMLCMSTAADSVSPSIRDALVFPSCSNVKKRSSSSNTLPDCLTSEQSIRTSALKQLQTVKSFARKEIAAKKKILKEKLKSKNKEKTTKKSAKQNVPGKVTRGKTLGKRTKSNARKALSYDQIAKSDQCSVCKNMTEDPNGWVQCDICDSWIHVSCIPIDHEYDQAALVNDDTEFFCHICVN